jgi:hypothetical protein
VAGKILKPICKKSYVFSFIVVLGGEYIVAFANLTNTEMYST